MHVLDACVLRGLRLRARRLLQLEEEVADPVLAAVVSLVIFETRNIESSNGGVHLGALKRMIDLRGGFDSLNHPAMMQKLCRLVPYR